MATESPPGGTPSLRRPAGRYGEDRPPSARSRAAYAVLAIAAIVGLGALLVVAAARSQADVRAELRGYEVLSPSVVRIRFDVEKAPLAQAVCSVRARDRTGAQVGQADVPVVQRGDRRRLTTVIYDLATTGDVAVGEVTGCSITRNK